MLGIIISLTLLYNIKCICTNITINTTSYDFTSLVYITSGTNLQFNFCKSNLSCTDQNLITRNTFIKFNNQSNCIALTRNRYIKSASTQPSILNYTINLNGITINYPPVKTSTGNYYTILTLICSLNNTFSNFSTTPDGLNTTIILYSQSGCSFTISNPFWKYLVDMKLVFALILWAVGLYSMFLGYFLVRITIFIYGAITAGAFSIIYFAEIYPQSFIGQTQILNFMIILSAILGIFYGFFLITLPKFGYFNIGVWWGAIISLLLQNGILYLSNSLIPFYITLGVICLVLGFTAIMSFKFFIITSTSMISGFLLVRPLGFFLQYYPNEFEFYQTNTHMPWQYYLYVISMLVLMAIGIIFQSWLFKKKGKKDKLYYLQEQGNFNEKLKKMLQFKQIRQAISKGKQQFQFLKKLMIQKQESSRGTSNYSKEEEFDQEKNKRKKTINTPRSQPNNYFKKGKKNEQEENIEIELVQIKPSKSKVNIKTKK